MSPMMVISRSLRYSLVRPGSEDWVRLLLMKAVACMLSHHHLRFQYQKQICPCLLCSPLHIRFGDKAQLV